MCSIGRKSSLRKLKQLPRSKFMTCSALLLFCWRRDQNSFFFFFFLSLDNCVNVPHVPDLPPPPSQGLQKYHNPYASCFLIRKTHQLFAWKTSCMCCVPGRMDLSWALSSSDQPSWNLLILVTVLLCKQSGQSLFLFQGPLQESCVAHRMSLFFIFGCICWLLGLVCSQLKIQLESLNLFYNAYS